MTPVRLSIGRLMIAIAIIAGGLGIIQIDRNNRDFYQFFHEYVIGMVPMACILLFSLMTCLLDLLGKGECHPFLVGFEALGWASLFVYASLLIARPSPRMTSGSRLRSNPGPRQACGSCRPTARNDAA